MPVKQLKVALFEPYYGGSHRRWADGLIQYSNHHFTLFTLPASHWKWRMQGAAISFSNQLDGDADFDVLLVSGMINLSLFKSLLPNCLLQIPIVLYMHENQFAYPVSPHAAAQGSSKDYHYSFLNYTSALAADQVWFNSDYNRATFIAGAKSLLKAMPDHQEKGNIALVAEKSFIQPLGLGLPDFNPQKSNKLGPIRILWNHRWEHDKNPAGFVDLLTRLIADQPIEVVVVGDIKSIEAANQLRKLLGDRLIHCGYVEDRLEYTRLVESCTILPVTSHHDFFGESVLEAVAMGVRPFLPRRLSYPEVLPFDELFYNDEHELYQQIVEFIGKPFPLSERIMKHVESFDWNVQVKKYDDRLAAAALQP